VAFLVTVALLPEPLDPTYASIANPLGLPGGLPVEAPLIVVNLLAGAVVLLTVPVAAVSLALRCRRARGLERQQLRWLAFAAGLASVGALLVLAGTSLPTSTATTLALITWGAGLCLVLLPLAIGAAILRYRLYDLDRIVSRTVACGLLTLLLGGGYAGIVLRLGRLAERDSSLVVAAATLAVAAVFQPLRRRIQAGVDRRFNRRRHGATPGPGRPGHPDRRAAGRGRPHHAAKPGVAVAATREERPPQPTGRRRTRHSAASSTAPAP
jgi:hypothetical protein